MMGRPENDDNPEKEQFRKLFIGGLDYRTTDTTLKQFYEQWGEIVDVVVMKHPHTQKSRGFGFVTYAKSEMVDEAMKNRPHKIDGRVVDSKRAVPRDSSGANNNINVKKMFVAGIKEQTEGEIREHFSTFGTIVGINIVMDKATGKRKGYAFIEYNDYDPVDKALLYKDHKVGGKGVAVKKAVVKETERGGAPSGGRGGRGGGGRLGGRGGPSGPGNWNGAGGGAPGWGSPANGYGAPPPVAAGGPWDANQSNGWGGAGGWGGDQYNSSGSSGWNNTSSGYGNGGQQGGYGGGPIRSNYNTSQRSAPYGGGNSGGYASTGGGAGANNWNGQRY